MTSQPVLRGKDERCEIYDLEIKGVTLSVTYLNEGQSTLGHKHDWEEAYYINYGRGRMIIGDEEIEIAGGSFIAVPANKFHRVFNDNGLMSFVCAWRRDD